MTRSLFFNDALDEPLPLGKLNARGLPYETYKLALTDDLLDDRLRRPGSTPDVTAALDGQAGQRLPERRELAERLARTRPANTGCAPAIAGFDADAAQHFYLPEALHRPVRQRHELDIRPARSVHPRPAPMRWATAPR